MSNVRNPKNNVSDNPFRPATPQMQSVGLNYGDRVKFQRTQPSQSSGPQNRQPVDQFDPNRNVDASGFSANANYKAQRRQTVEGYKPKMLDHVENGTAPRTRRDGAPSDQTILNFLDKVISLPAANKAQALKKQVSRV